MRKMTGAILVFVLGFCPSLVLPQPANIYTFNPDVKVTDAVPYDGTSSIFLSSGQHYTAFRGDTVYVVWWESRISNPPTGNHVFFAKSTDCGATFGASKRVNDIPAGFNPSMRVDSSGVIYVAYERQYNIFFSKSTDGGNTFTPSIMVVDSVAISAVQREPSIVVNNRRHIHIAWIDSRTNPKTIFTTVSYDGGQTFKENVQVGYRFYSESFDIAADENGRVYVAYGDTLGGQYGLLIARSVDSGSSFSSIVQVAQGIGGYPSLAVSKDGRVGVADASAEFFNLPIYFSVSSDFGQTFSPSVRVDTGYNEPDCYGGRLSLAASNGLFYVAWPDGRARPSDSSCILNVFLSYSPDGGRSFVAEMGRNTTDFSYSTPNVPSVAINGAGKVFVAWIDDRLDPVFQDYWYIFGATAIPHFIKGDLNLDAKLSPTDVAIELNAVYLGRPFPAPLESADGNCDTELTPADVALQINAVFVGRPFPCL